MHKLLPGILAAAIAAALAHLLHLAIPAVPTLTAAVALGIIAANIPAGARFLDGILAPGIGFSSKKFMRLGIVLLGLKLSIVDVANLGWPTLLVVIGIVILTFIGTLYAGRALGLPGDQPLLMAAGFSICGASAIGAMSAAAGSKSRDSATPIAMVTLCGTLAIAVLPLLARPLGLSPADFGFWVGASVHDVGQVVATAQTAGATALAVAVVVKLTRVLMLAPMVTATTLVMRSRSRAAGEEITTKLPPIVPLFVAGFLLAVALRSFGLVPDLALDIAAEAQEWLLAAALFALGAGVRVRELLRGGGRAFALAMLSWTLVAALSLGALLILP
ncbi:YeiH family protein [Mycetocola spongiae]|uniref:YeiH family protein n=1 Tax=Mycetocola spongiae TaxID=2859226 RepID=UPI001CF51293|nr:putative sulfate exporter family transporter [Mycetocola spongiae]UCR89205.1 putative sulfate exporter family transporter [Mycetocola spongiae]